MMAPFKRALVAFIVVCQLPFALVGNAFFIEFLSIIFPKIETLIPCRMTIKTWILEAYKERKEKLKEELQCAASMIHFSFDLWTSPNHLGLLGVVAHYVDEAGQNQSVSYVPLK
jgi:hypothetical protein